MTSTTIPDEQVLPSDDLLVMALRRLDEEICALSVELSRLALRRDALDQLVTGSSSSGAPDELAAAITSAPAPDYQPPRSLGSPAAAKDIRPKAAPAKAAPAKAAPAKAAPAKAAPAKPPAKRRQRANAPDYGVIAEAIVEFRAGGRPVVASLVERFGVPASAAKNWPARCRELGLLPAEPKGTPIRVIEDNTRPTEPKALDLAQVAQVAKEAWSAGLLLESTIADRFDVTKEVAHAALAACRVAGLLPPKGEPMVEPDLSGLTRVVPHRPSVGML